MAKIETASQRLDKWLWHARIGRTRSAAAQLIESGKVRVNRERITKPAHTVKVDDVITAALGGHVRVLKVTAFTDRRCPANEAQTLYTDLTPGSGGGAGRPSAEDDASAP